MLYVGIAPRYMANRTSTQNLRKRVRYHYRGNAAGSTLRLTLGSLLGLELRRVGSGKRMTFGKAGEATPSQCDPRPLTLDRVPQLPFLTG
ncbi:GIY-YIG nuclease family protein [Streptomyces prunicolor]|uniref:GIY-YIG nuclease family protein n=1 Tax=Streptomyces prunicolor TaxID=67348 RepID=UPI003430144B